MSFGKIGEGGFRKSSGEALGGRAQFGMRRDLAGKTAAEAGDTEGYNVIASCISGTELGNSLLGLFARIKSGTKDDTVSDEIHFDDIRSKIRRARGEVAVKKVTDSDIRKFAEDYGTRRELAERMSLWMALEELARGDTEFLTLLEQWKGACSGLSTLERPVGSFGRANEREIGIRTTMSSAFDELKGYIIDRVIPAKPEVQTVLDKMGRLDDLPSYFPERR